MEILYLQNIEEINSLENKIEELSQTAFNSGFGRIVAKVFSRYYLQDQSDTIEKDLVLSKIKSLYFEPYKNWAKNIENLEEEKIEIKNRLSNFSKCKIPKEIKLDYNLRLKSLNFELDRRQKIPRNK